MELLAKHLQCDIEKVLSYPQDRLIHAAIRLDSTAALLAVEPNPTIHFVRRWFARILLENALQIAQFLTENITVFKSDAFHDCELSMLADVSVPVLDWFLNTWTFERDEVIEIAATTTLRETFQYLHEKYDLKKEEFWNDKRFKTGWKYSSDKLRCYILDTFCGPEVVQFKDIQARLSASHCFIFSKWDPELLNVVITERQLDLLKLLIHYFCPSEGQLLELLEKAAAVEDPSILDYLSTKVILSDDVLKRLCQIALALPCLCTLTWLHEKTGDDFLHILIQCKQPTNTLSCVKQWLENLKHHSSVKHHFAHPSRPLKKQPLSVQYKILSEALQQEDFELANWCFHTGTVESGTELLPVYNDAAFANKLPVMNWIHFHFSALLTKATATVHLRLFYEGAPTTDVLEWLHQHFTLCLEDFSEENGLPLQQFVLHDRLDSLLWVHEHFTLTDKIMQQHYSRVLRLALCNENTHESNIPIATKLVELFNFPTGDVMRQFPWLLRQEDGTTRQWVVKTLGIRKADITTNYFFLAMSNETRDWLVDTFHFEAFELFDLYSTTLQPKLKTWLQERFQLETAYTQLQKLELDNMEQVVKAISDPANHVTLRPEMEAFFQSVVTSGQKELLSLVCTPLKFICQNVCDYLNIVTECVYAAANFGQLDCIHFLLEDLKYEDIDARLDMSRVFDQAVFGGRLNILEWLKTEKLYEPGPQKVQPLVDSNHVSSEVRAWLSEHYSLPPLRERCLSLAHQFNMEKEQLLTFVKGVRKSKTLLEINLLEKYLESTMKK